MKNTLMYVCSKCDAQTSKWSGRCLECGGWGALREEQSSETQPTRSGTTAVSGQTQPFSGHTSTSAPMLTTHLTSLDVILGGGLVAGSVTLIAGEPGIGKSTLLAQAALGMAAKDGRVMYVTGEESPAQIYRRLHRLQPSIPDSLTYLDETNAETVAATIAAEKPTLCIVDSIQSLRTGNTNGEAGSTSQVKACAAIITEAAKTQNIPVILVGQVTKDGDVAGPRVLEHVVDTVLFLEGDHEHRYRVLRCLKHRFGPTDETVLLSMTEHGLEPVLDPSSELLRDRSRGVSGSAITCLVDGHRAMLLEIQSLVSPAGYGTPVRRATGVDTARLGMLLAVLARRGSIQAIDKDVYANAVGGIDARDQSVDLALAAAIASAVKDKPLDPRLGMFGEIGLGGELRPVSFPELRLKEFARMGFTTMIVPNGQGKKIQGLEIKEAATLREALAAIGLFS